MAQAPAFPVSDHCDGRRFFNPRGHINRSWADVLRWRRTSQPQPWKPTVDLPARELPPHPGDDTLTCTFINHATFLLRWAKLTVLTDPVYSPCAGPFGWLGPRRVHPPGIAFDELPRVDVVQLSHDHYDHCDLPTLRRLARRDSPLAITPLGNADLLRRAGFAAERVIELDWWQTHALPDHIVTLTPARHWSNRLSGRRNARLWGGFHMDAGNQRVLFTGDTGYDAVFFREIGERLGALDLALIPIGAYEPRWFMAPQHCNPFEAGQIHLDLKARQSFGMHWGTFQLTDESREAPLNELAAARIKLGIASTGFRVLQPGETAHIPAASCVS
ncbi:MAG: MBL fold metallo-hydrolase [Opitutaceae bacterium]|nr:MBL fold metallo-hydrolase [Cephaloticoccus sp.]MCP5528921.1 MBL fold metallo-hydrolase [Opitutaceae bacterium]